MRVLMTKVVPQMIVCVIECAKEPCCRSINYKKTFSFNNEPICEMLHDVVNGTSHKFLETNSSYDHVHLINPKKVNTIDLPLDLSTLPLDLSTTHKKGQLLTEAARGQHGGSTGAARGERGCMPFLQELHFKSRVLLT